MRKYLLVLKSSLMSSLEYRGLVISSMTVQLLGIGASYFLWDKIVRDYNQIGQYNLTRIMTYYLLTGFFTIFMGKKVMKRFEDWVRSGELSSILVKPINPFKLLYCEEFGFRIGTFFISGLIPIIPIALLPSLRAELYLTSASVLWVVVYLFFSNTFLYLFYWTLGTLAFWFISLNGVDNVTFNLLRLLKGNWFPLDLAPLFVQNILSFLPFGYTMYYPIKIIMQETSYADNLKGITILVIYSIIFSIFGMVLWRKGIKKYESIGI